MIVTTKQISVVIGDHEALDAVCGELAARGDEVVRVEERDPVAEKAALDSIIATGRRISTLVIGHAVAPGGGSAARALALIRAAEPAFLTGAGRVVLLSGRDYLGWPGRAEAAIDLAGIVGLGRSLALELGQHGITVNVVCPPAELGAVEATDDPWAAPPPPPTGPVENTDVAYVVGFLSESASGYITGQVIHVSGGLSVLSSLSA